MPLKTEDKILIEQRVSNEAKSAGVAYLLLIFLGGFGAHRFYLGATGTAVAMLLLFILGWATTFIFVGFILLAIWGIWWFIDLFLIPGMVSSQKEAVRARLTSQALVDGQ
ncbi:MAG: TM2 domain-containing protein [Pararhodobacter sp.]|nr:TM2 domain-containing protein [Pararhodobacter sp.]